MKNQNRIEMDNIIRISHNKKIGNYFEAVVLRAQPFPYKRYGCIKLQFTKDLKRDIYYLCQVFWHLGLVVKSIDKLEDGLKVSTGKIIDEAYCVTLEKIGAINYDDNEEYSEFVKKMWDSKVK